MNSDISVVIPLYNKAAEIASAIESVLAQKSAPLEIIVINDGSTDCSPDIVRDYASHGVRMISQPNGGVSAARNNGARAARGRYIAFLDADDRWRPEYLAKITELQKLYPDCGAYAAAFDIASGERIIPNKHPECEGIVEDFFREAMSSYICQPSATVIAKEALAAVGGFPEGMKIGEDLYLWIRLADRYKICFTPQPLVIYSRTASNRSVGIYTPEKTDFSFEELYRPEENDSMRNEYIARCAIGKALTLSAKGDTEFGLRTERFFSYTKLYRRGWHKLHILNRIPPRMRPAVHTFYNRLAWAIARKGF